ncbi:MAG TPA: hypothetical protein VGM87_25960 [Roseomonas sp.]
MQRRIFLGGTMGAGLARPALAQSDWPSRQVRFLTTPTGTGPNGRVDIVALMQADVGKALGQRLSEIFGQPFGVQIDDLARGRVNILTAPRDGYALFHQPTPAVVQYDPDEFRSFVQPIARISMAHHILVVNRQVPARTVPDFLAQVRARPEQFSIAAMPGLALAYLPILFNQLIGAQVTGRLYPTHPGGGGQSAGE